MRHLAIFALLCGPAVLPSQPASHTVSPGMTRAQVVAALGEPATMRTASEYSYLFYRNSCGRACGMNDLVILRSDSVVDAIFRSPERHFTGTSSSPASLGPMSVAAKRPATMKKTTSRKDSTRAATPAKPVTPATPATTAKSTSPSQTQMKPPAKANDARPSIPLNEPAMKPAPGAAPAPPKKPSP